MAEKPIPLSEVQERIPHSKTENCRRIHNGAFPEPMETADNGIDALVDEIAAEHDLDRDGLRAAMAEALSRHDAWMAGSDLQERGNTLGFSREVRDAVLGHAEASRQQTYNKYDYLAEKREAMEAYGRHVMEIVE